MIRDHMKDADYFEGFLEYYDARIEEFENVGATLIEERGADYEGIHSLYTALEMFYFSKIIAMYSAGRPLEEVRAFLPNVVDIMERSQDPLVHESYDYYVETIWLSSIGIMLEVDQGLWSRIEKLLRIYQDQDVLADFLLNGNMKSRNSKFFIDRPYSKLYGVITSPHQDVKKLASYLKHDWYPAHDIAGWHDTHGIDDFVYRGYWSFESGAIVKILGLDDSSLKDVPYYPYDMVHYKD